MDQQFSQIEIVTSHNIAHDSRLLQSNINQHQINVHQDFLQKTNIRNPSCNNTQERNRKRPLTSNLSGNTLLKREKSLFPSYSRISHNILHQSQKVSAEKITQLKQSIHRIQSKMDIEHQHRLIKQTLLEFNKNSIDKIENVSKTVNSNQPASFQMPSVALGNKVDILDKDKEVFWDQQDFQSQILNQIKGLKIDMQVQQQKSKIQSGIHTTALMLKNYNRKQNQYEKESLNCLIQDDTQQQNHYESYLKFRKKILERQLETQMINKIKRGSQKKIPTNKIQAERINMQSDNCQKQRAITGSRSNVRRQTSTFNTVRANSAFHTRFGLNKQSDIDCAFEGIQNLHKGKQKQEAEKLFRDLYSQYEYSNQFKKSKGPNSKTLIGIPSSAQKNARVSTKRIINVNNDKNLTSSEQYQRNKNILLGNFSKYLVDLSHTNIVKWRIIANNQPSNPILAKNKKNKSVLMR